jgi:hypothetical protein
MNEIFIFKFQFCGAVWGHDWVEAPPKAATCAGAPQMASLTCLSDVVWGMRLQTLYLYMNMAAQLV